MATASPVRRQVVQGKAMDPVVLLGCILVVAAALTWVVPAGQYKRTSNSEGDALARRRSCKDYRLAELEAQKCSLNSSKSSF